MIDTLRMRVQDWFADHFKWVQYAVPRRQAPRAARYGPMLLNFLQALYETVVPLLIALTAFAGWLYERRGKRGELPVFILFAAALGAWLSGKMFVFLF